MLLAFALATITMVPPPIAVTSSSRQFAQSDPAVPASLPAVIDIHVTSADGLDWQDTLRVDRNSGASYSQSKSEAGSANCAARSSYDRSRRTSLNVQLNLRDDSERGPSTQVSVSWSRPTSAEDCQAVGTRGVQLEQSIVLPPGQTRSIVGDGGLRVTLTRR